MREAQLGFQGASRTMCPRTTTFKGSHRRGPVHVSSRLAREPVMLTVCTGSPNDTRGLPAVIFQADFAGRGDFLVRRPNRRISRFDNRYVG